jgi:hypothetical protein
MTALSALGYGFPGLASSAQSCGRLRSDDAIVRPTRDASVTNKAAKVCQLRTFESLRPRFGLT